jgi:mannosylglycerate hydrolase
LRGWCASVNELRPGADADLTAAERSYDEAVIEVGIVPHTHWDREWYAPFQEFRVQLVKLLDQLLPLLEQDRTYARFLLDGQTAVIDDYLAIRPEAAATFARLAGQGRVSFGPWMILMDEYMVSGETMVRDLQLGLERATELGAPMEVGYLPDMFGHVAQMPQLLRLAGLEDAVVWRGVPSAVDRTAFWWEAPDGSRVRAEYLYGSYSNGRDLPDDAKQLVGRARSYELELGPARLDGGGMLLMNGSDHLLPQPWLGRVVTEANEMQDEYRFVVTSLAEYLPRQPVDALPVWQGELRSGARANVLMGVASNRVDVHQACAAAERAIERRAEPLSALLLAADAYPAGLLGEAWRKLILNSAHDSSCACSADEVVDQVAVRYHEARQIGDSLTREALHTLAAEVDVPDSSTVVVNPSRAERAGLVQAIVPGEGPVHFVAPDGTACPTQVTRTIGGEAFSTTVTGQKVRWVLNMMRGPEFAGTRIGTVERTAAGDGTLELRFVGVGKTEPAIDLQELHDELLELADSDTTFRFRVMRPPIRDVVFAADPVPGFGWRAYRSVDRDGPTSAVTAGADPEGTIALANEHLAVTVDHTDGTYAVATVDGVVASGLGRLVDGGDGGDTYNYSPPAEDRIVDRPALVDVRVLEAGPVRARVEIASEYDWPVEAIGDERSCSSRSGVTERVVVTTTLEVRTGERFVRVHTSFVNRCRDHRLRAHFPLPAPVTGSDAECAFAVVHRGLVTEGGPHEVGLPTFVSRRFVDASDGSVGLGLVHDGLLEYEVVADGGELALTLLRATGYLSRSEMSLRPNPAGPLMPLRGPQLDGPVDLDYAVVVHPGDWESAGLYDLADEVLVPLERARGGGWQGAFRPASGQRLRVDGAQVSAVTRDDGALVVRLFNPSRGPVTATVDYDGAPASGQVVDLRGRTLEPFTGTAELRPSQILTLALTP